MRLALLLIFIAYPLLELAVLIRVGQIIGVAPTLAIVIGTAVLGLVTIKHQGLNMVRRARQAFDSGTPPVLPVAEGALVYVAGLLLVFPGLIGDAIGLVLLIPPVRRAIAAWGLGRFALEGATRIRVFTSGMRGGPRGFSSGDKPEQGHRKPGPIIEGEYKRLDDDHVDHRKTD